MLKKVIFALLIVIWCVVIFILSSMTALDSGSMSKEFLKNATVFTSGVAFKVGLIDHMPSTIALNNFVSKAHTPFRKLCHASEFFVLATILMFAIRKNTKFSLKNAALITLGICFLYSATDEIHQIFVNGRGAAFVDCLIDTAGALLAVGIYIFAKWVNINLYKKRA